MSLTFGYGTETITPLVAFLLAVWLSRLAGPGLVHYTILAFFTLVLVSCRNHVPVLRWCETGFCPHLYCIYCILYIIYIVYMNDSGSMNSNSSSWVGAVGGK